MDIDPQRAVAWRALSELFVDTQWREEDLAAVVRDLRRTPYDVAELRRIYEQEVAPVCSRHLTSRPEGLWTGFHDDWLIEAVHNRFLLKGHRRTLWRRLQVWWWTRGSRKDWRRLERKLTERGA